MTDRKTITPAGFSDPATFSPEADTLTLARDYADAIRAADEAWDAATAAYDAFAEAAADSGYPAWPDYVPASLACLPATPEQITDRLGWYVGGADATRPAFNVGSPNEAEFVAWLQGALPEAERVEAANRELPEWRTLQAAEALRDAADEREKQAELAILEAPATSPAAMALKMRVIERKALSDIDTGQGVHLVAAIDDAYRAAEPLLTFPVTVYDYSATLCALGFSWKRPAVGAEPVEWWPDDPATSNPALRPDARTMALIRRCREGLQRRIDRTPGIEAEIAIHNEAACAEPENWQDGPDDDGGGGSEQPVPPAPAGPDAELLALRPAYNEAVAAVQARDAFAETVPIDEWTKEQDDESGRIFSRLVDIEAEISGISPKTIPGLLFKAHVVHGFAKVQAPADIFAYGRASLAEDVLRLLGETPSHRLPSWSEIVAKANGEREAAAPAASGADPLGAAIEKCAGLAELNIQAWDEHPADGWTPPSNNEWQESLGSVRAAFKTLCRTKEQLADLWRNEPEAAAQLFDWLYEYEKSIAGVATVLKGATGRLIAVGAAIAKEQEQAESDTAEEPRQ